MLSNVSSPMSTAPVELNPEHSHQHSLGLWSWALDFQGDWGLSAYRASRRRPTRKPIHPPLGSHHDLIWYYEPPTEIPNRSTGLPAPSPGILLYGKVVLTVILSMAGVTVGLYACYLSLSPNNGSSNLNAALKLLECLSDMLSLLGNCKCDCCDCDWDCSCDDCVDCCCCCFSCCNGDCNCACDCNC
jgi:hypothetical protein